MGDIIIFNGSAKKWYFSIMIGIKVKKHECARDDNTKKFIVNIAGFGKFFYRKIGGNESEC
ncbi:hypothetical protein [Pectobacterium polaris]|uniref:hypothetical protein n=1 Tax=Pectobacterium polaris TaxID=2042057 RepID=UPI001CF44B90|nr:hypothetical protein [Pectobacterium polaris]MCA6954441.1 hypothetical protein [Pectobacterium polaris]